MSIIIQVNRSFFEHFIYMVLRTGSHVFLAQRTSMGGYIGMFLAEPNMSAQKQSPWVKAEIG